MDEDDADSRESESEKDDAVEGVWIVGNVEELEDEEMMCECRELREVEEGTGRPRCRLGCWAQIREDQCDGFSGHDAVQRDGFGKIRANRQCGVRTFHANRCDGFGYC